VSLRNDQTCGAESIPYLAIWRDAQAVIPAAPVLDLGQTREK